MSKHVSKMAHAAGWLLILLGFSVVGVTTFTWVGTYWRQAAAGSSPSWLNLLGGLLAGFGVYAAGLFVQVQGCARQRVRIAPTEALLEVRLAEEVPVAVASGD